MRPTQTGRRQRPVAHVQEEAVSENYRTAADEIRRAVTAICPAPFDRVRGFDSRLNRSIAEIVVGTTPQAISADYRRRLRIERRFVDILRHPRHLFLSDRRAWNPAMTEMGP